MPQLWLNKQWSFKGYSVKSEHDIYTLTQMPKSEKLLNIFVLSFPLYISYPIRI